MKQHICRSNSFSKCSRQSTMHEVNIICNYVSRGPTTAEHLSVSFWHWHLTSVILLDIQWHQLCHKVAKTKQNTQQRTSYLLANPKYNQKKSMCQVLSHATPNSIGAAKRRGKNPNLLLNWYCPHALCMRHMFLLVRAHVLHILWRQRDVESKVYVWLIHFM